MYAMNIQIMINIDILFRVRDVKISFLSLNIVYNVSFIGIGKGDIAKVGPTLFEFDLPENCPFELAPAVGTVAPGQVV